MQTQKDSTVTEQKVQNNNGGRWMLILLVIFFALPVVIVVAMHKFNVRPTGSSHGQLFSPSVPVQLTDAMLTSTGKPLNKGFWDSRWNLVYVTDHCEQICEKRLYDARQIHLSLAKEIERAQRVLVANQADFDALIKKYPDLLIVNQADTVGKLAAQFGQHSQSQQGLYFVDPLGNIVMFYKDNVPAKLVRADLLKLLKFSWAG
jgi:hypothetical protein